MRILLAVVLLGLMTAAFAATTPGTIVTTSASFTYDDSTGQQMPQQSSDAANVLVVSKNPAPSVLLSVRSLHFGPSTVGRTIKLVGNITEDQNGTFWIDDGSVRLGKDASGNTIGQNLYCKLSPIFLTQGLLTTQSGRTVVTGISQVETDGTPIVIPEADTSLRSLQP
jgi:hypothetical protein